MSKPKADPARHPEATSSGVETLIARLRDEGIQAGRQEADALLEGARRRAESIVADAEARAQEIVTEARAEADRLKVAGEEALKMATRDTILRFREELMRHLDQRVRRLVSEEMEDRRLLHHLIALAAARSLETAGVAASEEVEIQLPEVPLGLEELKQDADAVGDELSRLARQITGATWRDGVTFRASDATDGLQVTVKDRDLEVSLTPEAIADLLMVHLQPRFRALMAGIIQ